MQVLRNTLNRDRISPTLFCTILFYGKRLRSGKASCGCLTQSKRYMDIAGKQFGDIFVESFAYTKQGSTYWNCVFGCGNTFWEKVIDK